MTVAPPAPPYVGPAAHHGGTDNKPITRVVIHGTVSPCQPGQARNVARMFRTTTRDASAHYIVDPGEVVQCVYDSVVAYHAPPNRNSLGIELCDLQAGPGSRWEDANHRAMLVIAAKLVAELCLAYGVPIRKLSVSDLKAGKHGICGHVDVSNAFHQTTHVDPGSAFPWDKFMAAVQAEAKALQSGRPIPKPAPKPVPAPVPTPSTYPTIPATHPGTMHLDPYWLNNSYAGLLIGRAQGKKFADQDMHCDADGNFWGGHAHTPADDGFKWLYTGQRDKLGREVRIVDPNPRRPIDQRTSAEMGNLRRSASGWVKGGRYRKSWLHALWCKRLGILMCAEAKGGNGFHDPANWSRFRQLLTIHGCDSYVMTLSNIPGWYGRAKAAKEGGKFQTALLPRGAPPAGVNPADFHRVIDAVWSTDAAGAKWRDL